MSLTCDRERMLLAHSRAVAQGDVVMHRRRREAQNTPHPLRGAVVEASEHLGRLASLQRARGGRRRRGGVAAGEAGGAWVGATFALRAS
eukprot:COSAG05_NODE_8974_length_657_cov_1.177419_1_plen_89_part_00